ncbi:hypothetical protein GQ55_2G116400 [Panicum hallii var. hallii]|uniref:WRKY domain-containing protein n=1 Tax=Panicum hallii var. hallii TaxID=1504633 RepID=A0A2T7ENX9_9POAL|nr:hypothetical protein GQ55_2G116400 [Panicum hallii var. hallii]
MAAGPGGATVEQFIVGAQKSTNQLKVVLAKLLPAAGLGARAGAGSAVDALLSDITHSLSQALACLRLGALDTQRSPWQSSTGAGGSAGGGRRSAPTGGQRVRTDGACRMIVLQNGVQDSYTWRKYGQKDILGARFPRSYFRCSLKSGCPARKHVQRSDADPSKLEITYIAAHTCDDPPRPSSAPHIAPDPVTSSATPQDNAADRLVPVAAAPSSAQRCTGQPSPLLHPVPDLTAGSVPAALSSTQHDPVPDDTTFTPSMGEEQAELLFIPSPACSQSELLPAEVSIAKAESQGPPVWMEHDVEHDDDEPVTICDFMVPEM